MLEHDPELLSATRTKSDEARPGAVGGRPAMPWLLDQIVGRCLAKNPDERFQTAADLRQALRWLVASGSQVGPPVLGSESRGWRVPRAAWIAAGVVAIVAALMAAMKFATLAPPGPSVNRIVRFEVTPPPNAAFSPSAATLALSPDGLSLAFTASAAQGELGFWIQPLDSLEARRVSGTGGAAQILWSPDSRSVAFADHIGCDRRAGLDRRRRDEAGALQWEPSVHVYALDTTVDLPVRLPRVESRDVMTTRTSRVLLCWSSTVAGY